MPADKLQENDEKKFVELDPELDPDPLVRGTDPHQNVTDPHHWFFHAHRGGRREDWHRQKKMKFGGIIQPFFVYII